MNMEFIMERKNLTLI
ncbi:hypothetical protein LINPERPRIM_LOCUS24919 [Linum perenne]